MCIVTICKEYTLVLTTVKSITEESTNIPVPS